MQVQQAMLGRMQQFATMAEGQAVRPAGLVDAASSGSIGRSFEMALRSVDADEHRASAAMAAVDSGQSDDLAGAMVDSLKASVSFSALLQVRNKLTSAFEEVMRMPL
jgi:flagellar hook-basal body complex protein FliE